MLTKMVNGIEVQCSDQEEAQIRAEWEANENLPIPEPAITVEQLTRALIDKGVLRDADVSAAAVAVRQV